LLTNVAAAEEGILHPGYTPPPPPPGVTTVIEPDPTTVEAENRNGDSDVDLTTELTLLLIQNMLALF
jgi:hypothetical protein